MLPLRRVPAYLVHPPLHHWFSLPPAPFHLHMMFPDVGTDKINQILSSSESGPPNWQVGLYEIRRHLPSRRNYQQQEEKA